MLSILLLWILFFFRMMWGFILYYCAAIMLRQLAMFRMNGESLAAVSLQCIFFRFWMENQNMSIYVYGWIMENEKKINKTNEQNRSVKICNDIKIETNWNVRKTWYTFTIHILWTYRIPINDVICTDWTEVYIRFYTLVERKTKEKKNTKKKRN